MFVPIATSVPGTLVTEHLPRMARLAEKYAIVRSMQHRQSGHPAAAYWMMIGQPIARPANDAGFMKSRGSAASRLGALAKVLGPTASIPPFVLLPEAIQPNGPELAGQFAGFLGAEFDPYRINSDPNEEGYSPGCADAPHRGLIPPFGPPPHSS